ncbi:uncharacterized protein LOC116424957 [Nomia melanderi]|uniref:uncharacterized protein LOC116424957 n=1 Tax=Nomia melanderi TaxID=2448451 RepID=UPI00130450DD|nr:uncharacterized protein LOC116424957 [Nomia melanderi]
MDSIMTLKNKHVKVTDAQMKEMLQQKIMSIDNVKTKQDQHCNEDEIKIQELMLKITSMKENLQSEKQISEYKEHTLSKHLDCIAELEAEKNKFLDENHSLELERNKLKARKRNLRDQELLDQGRKKYNLYKELTRIRWDYENLTENAKGYVSNKVDYIHHFCYKNEIHNLVDLLWHEIIQSTLHAENKDSDNKENVMQTKQT